MNIQTSTPWAQPTPRRLDAASAADFADSLIDDMLALPPERGAFRLSALKRLDARMQDHFARHDTPADTCVLVTAILGAEVTAAEVQELAGLKARFPDYKVLLTIVHHHVIEAEARRAAHKAQAAPQAASRALRPVVPETQPRAQLDAQMRRDVPAKRPAAPPIAPKPVVRPAGERPAEAVPLEVVHRPVVAQKPPQKASAAAAEVAPRAQRAPATQLAPRVIAAPDAPAALEARYRRHQQERMRLAEVLPLPLMRSTAQIAPLVPRQSPSVGAPSPVVAADQALRHVPRRTPPAIPQALALAAEAAPARAQAVATIQDDEMPPPPYTAIYAAGRSVDDGMPGPSQPRVDDSLVSDLVFAQNLLMQEEDDYAFAMQLQLNDDGNHSDEGLPLEETMTDARRIDGQLVPAALVCPVTHALYVNPLFDKRCGRTVDGPHDLQTPLPATHVRDQGVRDVLDVWQQHHGEATLLGNALREALTCSITQEVFVHPVVAGDGYTYEETAIREWLVDHDRSPMTREPLSVNQLWQADVLMALMRQYGIASDDAAFAEDQDDMTAQDANLARMMQLEEDDAAADSTIEQSEVERETVLRGMGLTYENVCRRYFDAMRLCNAKSQVSRFRGGLALGPMINILEDLVAALTISEGKPIWYGWLSDCYRLKKDYAEALNMLSQAASIDPGLHNIAPRRALLQAILGQVAQAEQSANQAESRVESNLFKYAALGEVCRRRGQFGRALEYFTQSDATATSHYPKLRQVAVWRELAIGRSARRSR